jgi:hypothetical protein
MADPDEDDAEEIIYHGTSVTIANKIFAAKRFDERETFFASVKDLAFYFADRTIKKSGRTGITAILKIGLYRSDLNNWRTSRLVQSRPFDEGDAGELRGKTQLIFNGEAIRFLNAYSFKDDWQVEVR